MDSVLCGNDDATFHDEGMVLYYMNHEMIKFGQGKYSPKGCDGSALTFPVDSTRCALMMTGEVFEPAG